MKFFVENVLKNTQQLQISALLAATNTIPALAVVVIILKEANAVFPVEQSLRLYTQAEVLAIPVRVADRLQRRV